MSHVVESATSRRHRRNRRTAIVLVVLVALLAGAFYYAATYFNRPSTPAASSDCPTGDFTAGAGAAAALAPGQVTVNVFNSTKRAGLAASTAKDVKARGFVVGQVTNDPAKKKIDGPAEVRFGPNGKAGAELVVKLVDGADPDPGHPRRRDGGPRARQRVQGPGGRADADDDRAGGQPLLIRVRSWPARQPPRWPARSPGCRARR